MYVRRIARLPWHHLTSRHVVVGYVEEDIVMKELRPVTDQSMPLSANGRSPISSGEKRFSAAPVVGLCLALGPGTSKMAFLAGKLRGEQVPHIDRTWLLAQLFCCYGPQICADDHSATLTLFNPPSCTNPTLLQTILHSPAEFPASIPRPKAQGASSSTTS